MKIGTRVQVDLRAASLWGYKTPANGVVIGKDPDENNLDVVTVQLDQGESIFQYKGINISKLMKEEDLVDL